MRLVVKVGTSLIAPDGRIDTHGMRALVDQLALSEHEYLIVSSGAIASGMSKLGLIKRPSSVPRMQACAAVGQSLLMHTYEQLFFGKKVVSQLAGRCKPICTTVPVDGGVNPALNISTVPVPPGDLT